MQVIRAMVSLNGLNEDALPIDRQPERRQFGRRAAFKSAVVILDDGRRLPGAVIDFSDAGARIKLADAALVGPEFDLEIPGDDFVVKCRLAHAEGIYIGAQYIKPPRRISWSAR
jgi:hypothetical protein